MDIKFKKQLQIYLNSKEYNHGMSGSENKNLLMGV